MPFGQSILCVRPGPRPLLMLEVGDRGFQCPLVIGAAGLGGLECVIQVPLVRAQQLHLVPEFL